MLIPTLSNQARRKTDLSPRILATEGSMKMTQLMVLSWASFLLSPFSRVKSGTPVLSGSEVNKKYAFDPCSMSAIVVDFSIKTKSNPVRGWLYIRWFEWLIYASCSVSEASPVSSVSITPAPTLSLKTLTVVRNRSSSQSIASLPFRHGKIWGLILAPLCLPCACVGRVRWKCAPCHARSV